VTGGGGEGTGPLFNVRHESMVWGITSERVLMTNLHTYSLVPYLLMYCTCAVNYKKRYQFYSIYIIKQACRSE
jgi:hypothetical protein